MARVNNPMLAGKIVIFLLFVLIVLLTLALTAEYQSNQYQQDWIQANIPWLQYLLNGYLAAALVGIVIGATCLLVADILRNRAGRGRLKTVV